jgi:hypothetical protein
VPWKVSVPAEPPVVVVEYTGMVSAAEFTAAATEIVERAMAADRFLLLADITKSDGGPGREELLQIAQALADSGIGACYRDAVVYAAGTWSEADALLWENACVERGLQVPAFSSREAALGWLLVT